MWQLKYSLPLLLWCGLIATETKFRRSNPYVADAVGNTLPAPSVIPSKVGSPSILLTPDRYEFYTFDETGELVKQLMTLDEIQAIVASDDESEGHMVTLAQTDLHKPAIAFNFSHPPPVKVHSVVTNVQNVLKSQIEAHKRNPPNPQNLDTPDVSASWSMILPSIFGNTGIDIVPDKLPNSFGTPETDTLEMVTKRESLDEMILTTESNAISVTKQTKKPTTDLQDSRPSTPEELQTVIYNIAKDNESSTIATKTDLSVTHSAPTLIKTTVDDNILDNTESSTQAEISNSTDMMSSSSSPLTAPESQTNVTFKTSIPTTSPFISTTVKPVDSSTRIKPVDSSTTIEPVDSFITVKSVDSLQLLPNSSDQSNFVKISDSINAVKLNSTTVKVSITELPINIQLIKHEKNDTTNDDATSNVKEISSTEITNGILKTETVTTTPMPLTNINVSVTEDLIQSELVSTKDSLLNNSVDTTTKASLLSNFQNEVTNHKPVFNVAESISQIASDLGSQFNSPEIEQYDLEVKGNTDVKFGTSGSQEIELTTQLPVNGNISNQTSNNSNQNVNLSINTGIETGNFVKISTLEPNKLNYESNEIHNKIKVDNITVTLESVGNITALSQGTFNEVTTVESTLELSESMNDLLSQVVEESPQPVIQISHFTDITTPESALNRNEDLELIPTVQPVNKKVETKSTEITTILPETHPSTILGMLSTTKIMPLSEGLTETTTLLTILETIYDVTTSIELTESLTQPTTEIIPNTVNHSTTENDDDLFIPITKLNASVNIPPNKFVTNLEKYTTTLPTILDNEETTLKTSTKLFSSPSTNFVINESSKTAENIFNSNTNEPNDIMDRIPTDTTEKTTSIDTMETLNTTFEYPNQITSKNNTQKVVYSDENIAIPSTKSNVSSVSEIKNDNQLNSTTVDKDVASITKVNNAVTEVEQIVTFTDSTTVKINDNEANKTNGMDLDIPITMATSTINPTSSLLEVNITKEYNTEALPNIEVTTATSAKENATVKILESLENISASTSPSTVKAEDPKKKVQKVNIDFKEHMEHALNNTWTLISTLPPPKYVTGHQKEKNNTNIKSPSSNVIKTQSRPRPSNNEPSKHINLDGSKENQGLEATTKDLNEDVYQFSELCNELAFRYWNAIKERTGDNKRSLVFSPYAITSMLAMIFMGARGATSGEMNEILRLDDMVTFNPHFVLKNISDSIEVSMRAGVVASTFVRELYSDRTRGKLLTFYKERAQHFYSGLVEETNFKLINDIIRRRTNLLVKRNTWGKIAEYFKANTITMRPPLAAFSANIFETDCSTSSTEGRDGEMYFVVSPSVRQRRLVPIPSVVYKKGFLAGYDPVLDATAASIGTGDQVTSTIFLMPGQQGNAVHSEDLDILQKRIQGMSSISGAWNRLMRTLLPRLGLELQVPRFAHRSLLNISTTLQSMGLSDLFDPEKADLRGLSGLSNDLYVSDIMQSNLFATCGEGIISEQHHVESYPDEPIRRRRSLWYSPSLSNAEYRWTDGWEEPRDYQRAFHDPHDLGVMYMPLHLRPRQARLPPIVAPEVARLKLDRPFLYFVRHNLSGMILYMGRFNPRLLP